MMDKHVNFYFQSLLSTIIYVFDILFNLPESRKLRKILPGFSTSRSHVRSGHQVVRLLCSTRSNETATKMALKSCFRSLTSCHVSPLSEKASILLRNASSDACHGESFVVCEPKQSSRKGHHKTS